MDVNKLNLIILSVTFLPLLTCHDIGDPCPRGKPGVCVSIKDCTSALRNLKFGKRPQFDDIELRTPIDNTFRVVVIKQHVWNGQPLCSFRGQMPIVCCNDLKTQPKQIPKMITIDRRIGGLSTIASTSATTTAADSNSIFRNHKNFQECPPLPSNLSVLMTGQKAFDKCIYYQEKYLYPCVESPVQGQNKTRADFCSWSPESLIINGKDALRGEFPHTALLGFGTTRIDWKCGGIIVTPTFVLTVAHCTKSSHSGRVKKIKIGILKRSEPNTNKNVYDVHKIYVHEGYHSPRKYNDIALLKTSKEMQLNPFALPACLHDGSPVNDAEVIVTGWGATNTNKLSLADNLQKAYLSKVRDFECIFHYRRFKNRNLWHGIDRQTQMCFGDKKDRTDTCGGDSGGPAQIRHPRVHCMYLVLGLTSYGRPCGHIGEPGVYTRVSHYLSWIESIVWP